MTDLSTVQTAEDRKTVCDTAVSDKEAELAAAIAAASDPDVIAAREALAQTAYQAHYSDQIADWCNETDPADEQADQSTLSLAINELVDSGVLDGWETDLIAQGYVVVREGADFTISLE